MRSCLLFEVWGCNLLSLMVRTQHPWLRQRNTTWPHPRPDFVLGIKSTCVSVALLFLSPGPSLYNVSTCIEWWEGRKVDITASWPVVIVEWSSSKGNTSVIHVTSGTTALALASSEIVAFSIYPLTWLFQPQCRDGSRLSLMHQCSQDTQTDP